MKRKTLHTNPIVHSRRAPYRISRGTATVVLSLVTFAAVTSLFGTRALLADDQSWTPATMNLPRHEDEFTDKDREHLCGLDTMVCPEEKPTPAPKATQKAQIKPVARVAPKQAEGAVAKQIRQIAKAEGFKDPDYLIALAECESTLNPNAVGDGGKSRGAFQIHRGYHPTVSASEAHDLEFSTKWTIGKIEAGGYRLWTCGRRLGAPNA